MSYPLYLLPSVLCESAKLYPDKIALIIENQFYSYQAICRDAILFSNQLKQRSNETRSRVLIRSGNSYTSIIAFWGSLFAGFVPCIVDPDFDADIQQYIFNHLSPVCVVELGESVENSLPFVDVINRLANSVETDLAMIMHTSGSTGFPKGVMLSHRNVLSAVESISTYLEIKKEDVILNALPLHFDYGLYQMLLAFYKGATLVLEKNGLFPQRISHQINRYKVTVMPCVPVLVQLFFKIYQSDHKAMHSVRLVTNTGEYLSANHIEKIQKIFPSATVFSMYGLTECKRCSYIPPLMLHQKTNSIGMPMPNLNMWIQDPAGNRLPPGVEGELVISGPTVMLGYWRDKSATAKKITQTDEGVRLLHTGDRAVMDEDGFFYFKGRDDYTVKFNGAKLNCHELIKKISNIENILRAHLFLETIDDVNQLMLCLEYDQDQPLPDELKLKILKVFSAYQKPNHIFCIKNFPVLSNGKINIKILEKMAIDHYAELLCK